MHAPNPTEPPTPTKLIIKIQHATQNSTPTLTVQDVLNVARHVVYRTHGHGNPLKTRSRDALKPLVSKYGIGDRKLRAILQILTDIEVLDRRPRISNPGPTASILLEYIEQLPTEPEVSEDVWSEVERATSAAGLELQEVRAVLQYLFYKQGALLVVKGRDRLVKDLTPYNIGGRKLRRILQHLDTQGILVHKTKKRFPSAQGEKLYDQLLAGEIPIELPEISEKLTVERVEKDQAQEQYLKTYQEQNGAPPTLEDAKSLLVEIWNVPSINRKKLAHLLQEETGVSISEATISRYKLGKRTMPDFVRGAIHILHRQLNPEQLAQDEKEQRTLEETNEKRAKECLQDLFHKGLPYSEITEELRQVGLDVSRDILYHQAQGSMRIDPNQVQMIIKFWQKITQEYHNIPTPTEVADMLQALFVRGYSMTKIATMVYEKLSLSKKEIIWVIYVQKTIK